MKRPLSDKRPIGPLSQIRGGERSEFDAVEIDRNRSSADARYTVAGIHNPGGTDETIGLVVETNSLTVNRDAFFIGEEGAKVGFNASPNGTVAIGERGEDLTNIIVE